MAKAKRANRKPIRKPNRTDQPDPYNPTPDALACRLEAETLRARQHLTFLLASVYTEQTTVDVLRELGGMANALKNIDACAAHVRLGAAS